MKLPKGNGAKDLACLHFTLNNKQQCNDWLLWNKIAANYQSGKWYIRSVSIHLRLNKKSRVKGDFQARFRGNVRVKFPRVTRLCVMLVRPANFNRLTKSKLTDFKKLPLTNGKQYIPTHSKHICKPLRVLPFRNYIVAYRQQDRNIHHWRVDFLRCGVADFFVHFFVRFYQDIRPEKRKTTWNNCWLLVCYFTDWYSNHHFTNHLKLS